ncbi:MAG: hypothetical protein M5U26_25035 [Planctomycetota bacterium]|nr:hypothetical protein [Planctomycetota bacterium]
MSTASGTNDLELLIEEYVEGRLDGEALHSFEARLEKDAELRKRVQTTTQSIELLRKVLTRVDPGPGFEGKVNTQIISITQSNPGLIPARRGKRTSLTSDDSDAKLIVDPSARKERKRLMALAAVAAILFALAAALIVTSLLAQSEAPAAPPASGGR